MNDRRFQYVLRPLLAALCAWASLARAQGAFAAEATKPDAAGIEFFEKSVRPILVKHCYECHAGEEKNGGLLVDSREGLLTGGDSGPAILPGNLEKSRLIEAVRYKNSDLQMPPQNRLSTAEIATLENWVARGAPDPRVATAVVAPTHGPMGMSIEDGRQFWSFRPIGSPSVPKVKNAAWVRTPIDAFVLAKLEGSGLDPAPPADPRTLVRRVTFDLTGLPPTSAEVQDFVEHDVYSSLIERLLNSPRYGERWGRHWLDVARYADSNGLDENLAFGNAWRYRDYVINAFNQDKPFDRFLVEQIAGDLLPGANQETRTATGYLVLGAKVLAEPDREKLEMDTIDEQLDAIGKTFLGMTFGCVRCHDHKFDPLKQTDYYALAAIFKSTTTFGKSAQGAIKHWHEDVFAKQEELEKLKEIDAKISEKKKAASSYKSTATTKIRNDARAKAALYLKAAAEFEPSMPLTQVEEIAKPLGLHPHILHHCRLHLEYHRDDPFFGRWHELAAAGEVDGIEKHYNAQFTEAEAAWATAKKADPKATKLSDERLELARAALYDLEGFLAVPPKPEFAFDPETLAEYHRLAEEARIVESSAPDVPAAMAVADGVVKSSLPIHIRGSHRNLGQPVSRGFPEVMRAPGDRPILPANESGRLELARWMVDRRHPLTARVYVNRVWRWHFGTGLVASTDNFGKLGDRPSHPELLDWLARRFIESGWSTKELHRLILMSNTYRMTSAHPRDAACAAADPENRWLWKFPVRRLEAEPIRDAILAVSGRLDTTAGGKTIPLRNKQFVFDHTSIDHTRYDSLRRAVYLPVVRNNLYTLFEQFDYPDPTMPTGSRNATVVAPQALLMLNSDLVLDSAAVWADRLLESTSDDAERIRQAYEAAFARLPTSAESERARAFIADLASRQNSETARRQAWTLFCHSLLASNEFIYVR